MSFQKTVIVGMSGGVDSAVSAYLLKEQGYKVIALFMKNWEEVDASGVCHAATDYEDVISVCNKLEIPYYAVDFVKEYREQVFAKFLSEYNAGFTPNPDVLCNREIKFKVFWEKARELGADYLATGHYCQLLEKDGQVYLAKGLDDNKDQSYFLYMVKDDVLRSVLFPVGGLTKPEVRKIARKLDLSNKDKKDSTGICFIGERNFREFLSKYIKTKAGNFETPEGEIVGEHVGCSFYTIGQRKGLGLGGPGAPWFVLKKDISRNVVIVGRGEDHPLLYASALVASEITWVSHKFSPVFPYVCKAKIRYRQADQEAILTEHPEDKNRLVVKFSVPQRAITLGQSVVFYDGVICLGGGIISELL